MFRRTPSCFLAIAVLAMCIFADVASARSAAPELSSRDIAVLEEAYHLWREKGDEVWPGWSSIDMPVLWFNGLPLGAGELSTDRSVLEQMTFETPTPDQ